MAHKTKAEIKKHFGDKRSLMNKLEVRIDISDYEYMIVFRDPDRDGINTWCLPDGSFQMNLKSMKKRGCEIINVFHRMTDKELLESVTKIEVQLHVNKMG